VQYEWTFTVPANTPESDPLEEVLQMDSGVVVGMEIYNPPGSHRYCRCRILEGLSVLWPGNPTGYIATDGTPVPWSEHYVLKSPDYRLTLRAWNISLSQPHDVVVRINVLPAAAAAPFQVITDLVDMVKKLLGV
jgi:hypothetical protein